MSDIIRIWYEPGGTIKWSVFAAGVEDRDIPKREGIVHPAATWEDVSRPAFLAMLPTTAGGAPDPSRFHQLVKHPTQPGLMVDPAIPEPPHPKQRLLDDIAAAGSVPELKAILRRVVRGES